VGRMFQTITANNKIFVCGFFIWEREKMKEKKASLKDRRRAADLIAIKAGRNERTPDDIEKASLLSDAEVFELLKYDNDITPATVEEIRPDGGSGSADLFDVCNGLIENICIKYDLDKKTLTPLQWGFICSRVGAWFSARSTFRTLQKNCIASNNYQQINIELLADAVPVWAALCEYYNKTPLICDFCAFCGISDDWLYKNLGGVTLSGSDFLQKLHKIQENGLNKRILNPKENPVGAIFLQKAINGYNETTIIRHESGTTPKNAHNLPVFGSFESIEDKSGQDNEKKPDFEL